MSEPMDLQLSSRQVSGATIVSVGGEIDHATAPRLREAIDASLGAGSAAVVVDLTDTDFLDSSALGTLVGANKAAHRASTTFAIVCPKPHLRRLFEISRLDQVLPVHDDFASTGISG